ncbi:MAG: response regulator transcription factor [Anaerolineaceae bacterium]
MSTIIHVLVVDDHPVVRKGILALLETESDIEVIGEASDGAEAIRKVATLKQDVILMDLVIPNMDGIEAIRRIKADQPDARILVLTSFTASEKIFPSINAGALGYLLKDSNPEDLIRAIHQVYRGQSSLHPAIARKVLQELAHTPQEAPTPEPLTDRETEVLKLIAQGLSNQDIAEKLVLSEATVHTHVSKILSKLHLSSRTQAALYALRQGLVALNPTGEDYE